MDIAALASSEFSGRGYVNDGCQQAGYYLTGRFREEGLLPLQRGYLQYFELTANTWPEQLKLQANGTTFKEGYDFITIPSTGSSKGTYTLLRLKPSHFKPPYKKIPPLRGKLPVIDMKQLTTPDEVSAVFEFQKQALQEGPVILLKPDKLTWSVADSAYPQAGLEVLRASFPERAKSISIDIRNRQGRHEVFNVVGYLPGLRSDSVLVVTAHYDHLGMMGQALFPGASDNASGVAAMLDIAAHFKKNRPPFDMYFIAFAGEEAGLVGSHYFVQNPLFELSKVKLLLNLDLMGSAAKGIVVVNGKLYPEVMHTLTEINKREGYVPSIRMRGKAANSDHYWFSEAGVRSVFVYTEGNISAYHDVYDTHDGVDLTNYESVFRLLVRFLSEI